MQLFFLAPEKCFSNNIHIGDKSLDGPKCDVKEANTPFILWITNTSNTLSWMWKNCSSKSANVLFYCVLSSPLMETITNCSVLNVLLFLARHCRCSWCKAHHIDTDAHHQSITYASWRHNSHLEEDSFQSSSKLLHFSDSTKFSRRALLLVCKKTLNFVIWKSTDGVSFGLKNIYDCPTGWGAQDWCHWNSATFEAFPVGRLTSGFTNDERITVKLVTG